MSDPIDDALPATALDAIILQNVIREYREGRNPRIPLGLGHQLLVSLGRPLSASGTRDLMVETKLLNGRNTVLVGDLIKAADANITRQLARPNLKAKAAATARAARKPRQLEAGGLNP